MCFRWELHSTAVTSSAQRVSAHAHAPHPIPSPLTQTSALKTHNLKPLQIREGLPVGESYFPFQDALASSLTVLAPLQADGLSRAERQHLQAWGGPR